MWKIAASCPNSQRLLDDMPTTRRFSRLSQLKKHVVALGWSIDFAALDFSPFRRLVRTRDDDLGKVLAEKYRKAKFIALALRRPRVYAGLTDVDLKKHRVFLASLSPYSASTMIRVWNISHDACA